MTLHQTRPPAITGGDRSRRRTWTWVALGGALVAIVLCVDVTITDPRVGVRWHEGVGESDRETVEDRHQLRNGVGDGRTW